jgi:hypothetical protein
MATPNQQASNDASSAQGFKPAEKTVEKDLNLSQSLEKLSRVGGFDLLETTIDGLQNLNPERKARKQIFLTDDEKKLEREELKQKLSQWIEALETGGNVGEMVTNSTEKLQLAEENLNTNIHDTLESTRDLEQAYRSLQLFYKNTESDKVKNVVIMNASLDQLKELDNPRFIDYVGSELKQNYDRLDLRQELLYHGYSGLPGVE